MADPWFKFYPTDWRADPALRMCSATARGVWIDLICLMHEATPYGHLLINGHCPTDTQVAVLLGMPPQEFSSAKGELEQAGVFSHTKDGVIYSRKMTRRFKKAATARRNGRLGGNPKLSKESENPALDNPEVKGGVKPQKPEARSQNIGDTNVSLSSADDARPLDEISEAVKSYNAAARQSGWPQVKVLSKARRSAIAARLRDCGGLEGWAVALAKAQSSNHCCGQNDRGWVASFDFMTRQSSFNKLMEGNYDNRPGSSPNPRDQLPTRPTPRANSESRAISDAIRLSEARRATYG